MLSYYKITMPPMVRSQLISVMAFLFLIFPPGFIVLGLDYFFGDPVHLHTDEAGFDKDAWMAKSKQQAREAFPNWIKEVRNIYGKSH